MRIPVNTSQWLYYYLVNNEGTPVSGLTYNNVRVFYAPAYYDYFLEKSLSSGNFVELGKGIYKVCFSASELFQIGPFITVIEPAISGTFIPVAREDEIYEEIDIRSKLDTLEDIIRSNFEVLK